MIDMLKYSTCPKCGAEQISIAPVFIFACESEFVGEIQTNEGVQCLNNQLASAEARNKSLCEEWAEDHTHAQQVAMSLGYTKEQVEGDSFYVPGIKDLINMIAEKVKK